MNLFHPPDLFDRQQEWQDLSAFVSDPGPGLRVGVVYGRRRQGKSYLLRRLVSATKGFYHQALGHEPAQALAELGSDFGLYLGVGRLAFGSWSEAIGSLARQSAVTKSVDSRLSKVPDVKRDSTPAVIVLDEFPYLADRSSELPSVIQRVVDQSQAEQWPAVRLILCGSALSTMSGILAGQNPLRGRVRTQILIKPFDYQQAAKFWGLSDPFLAFRVHTIVGGTPGYRDLVRSVPTTLKQFDQWVIEEVLNPSTALFREDEWLLGEEPTLTDKALYMSVLSAISSGNNTPSQIAASLGREQKSLQHPLDALLRTGFLEKDEDLLRQRRPQYRIVEPIIRFHQAIRNPDIARYEDRQGADAWRDAQSTFESLILGPHFERIAREYVSKFAPDRVTGGSVASIGTTVVADRQERARYEIDIVALGRGSGVNQKIIQLIGEAKLRTLKCADLQRLDRIKEELERASRISVKDTRFVLASAQGFEDQLVKMSRQRQDVSLVGLASFYGIEI